MFSSNLSVWIIKVILFTCDFIIRIYHTAFHWKEIASLGNGADFVRLHDVFAGATVQVEAAMARIENAVRFRSTLS